MTDRNFTGQNQDLTTGSSGDLYDFAYREYHPIHGRWISPDPAGLAAVDQANPQSWNRYAYVNGSPLNSVDPLGLTPICVKQGTCVGESIVHDYGGAGAGIYGSLTFAGTLLGVQTLTLGSSGQSTSAGAAPTPGTDNGVVFWAPTYNADGSLASLDRQSTDWSNPAGQGSSETPLSDPSLVLGAVVPPGMNPAAQAAKQLAQNMTRNGAWPKTTSPPPLQPGPDFRQIPPGYKPPPAWIRLLKLIGGGFQNVAHGSTEVVIPLLIIDPCAIDPSILPSCGWRANGPS